MALFVRQDENRSELQQRLATELQDRARKKAEEAELPDGVTDSQYIKGTKETTSLLWVWMVIAVLAIGAVIFLVVKTGN
ncbi:MAG: hypothetical protein JWO99_511 [Candidatus Saccharibacteria bacterium]|nr:hypothetical protein [Candidatus Saccharibacteria bacterium]